MLGLILFPALFLTGLCVLLGAGHRTRNVENVSEWVFGIGIAAIIFGAVFSGCLAMVAGLGRSQVQREMVERQAVIDTLASRTAFSEIERAAIFTEVVKWNTWLAGVQYRNRGNDDICIPDVVDTLQPIR